MQLKWSQKLYTHDKVVQEKQTKKINKTKQNIIQMCIIVVKYIDTAVLVTCHSNTA